jgi:hypothetical protein
VRYFFHFRSPTHYFRDGEGDDLPDLAAAYEEGRRSARDLMSIAHGEPHLGYDGAIFEITAADGAILGTIRFEESELGEMSGIEHSVATPQDAK